MRWCSRKAASQPACSLLLFYRSGTCSAWQAPLSTAGAAQRTCTMLRSRKLFRSVICMRGGMGRVCFSRGSGVGGDMSRQGAGGQCKRLVGSL